MEKLAQIVYSSEKVMDRVFIPWPSAGGAEQSGRLVEVRKKGTHAMSDEMFFSNDDLSLLRGNRSAARTEVCRPCLVAARGPSPKAAEGVILDMNPHGMLVRMLKRIPVGSRVVVQMMRDDNFQRTFSVPRDGTIVRTVSADDGFTDHGVKIINERIRKASERPILIEHAGPRPKSAPARMHTIDVTIGGRRGRRGR